jgi:hypothetical protein
MSNLPAMSARLLQRVPEPAVLRQLPIGSVSEQRLPVWLHAWLWLVVLHQRDRGARKRLQRRVVLGAL